MMTRRRVVASGIAASFPLNALAKTDGYRVQAEETQHERTFMQWPVSRIVHPDPVFLEMTQQTIADIANTISEFEPVVMLAAKANHKQARRYLSDTVTLWDVPTEDLWCRDAGPLFASNGRNLRVHNLNFNGWGGKQVHNLDGKIAQRVAQIMGLELIDTGVVGEAGGIESDGQGTLIAHESSWVNINRNTIVKAEIERRLLAAYGAEKLIWAPGISGQDITDYHIDSLARFVDVGRVLIQLPTQMDPNDQWSTTPFETHDILTRAIGANGRELNIQVIEDPTSPRIRSDEFVASYANYYICNGAVICAEFGDTKADEIAQATLADIYPDRDVIALNVDPLGEMGGGIHCATQQQPALI